MDAERRALLRLMTYMMCADGHIDDAEISTIRSIFLDMTGEPLDDSTIGDEVIAVADDHSALVGLLDSARDELDESRRERLLEAAMRVAAADGVIEADELAALSSVAQALLIDRPRFNAILEGVESAA